MVATSQGRLEGLQILRAIAAIMVLFHHAMEESLYTSYAMEPPHWFILLGAAGVDLFFVISGFIMVWTSFPTHRPDTPPSTPLRFLKRRIARIYPVYWVCCAIVFALKFMGFYDGLELSADLVIRSLLLFPYETGLVYVAWTLVYEMMFYLVFAIALLARGPAPTVIAAIIILLGMFAVASFSPTSTVGDFAGNPIVFEFCFGMILALTLKHLPAGRLIIYGVGAIVGLVILAVTSHYIPTETTGAMSREVRFLAWGLPSVLIVTFFLNWQPGTSQFERFCLLCGDASYSIYLFHIFVMITYAVALRKVALLAELNQWLLLPFVIAAGITAGIVMHLLVEKPLIRWSRRWI